MTATARQAARVLIVGCGGLGAPNLLALADAGLGCLGVVDDDDVDLTNLHRQIVFDEVHVGRAKTESVKAAIEARFARNDGAKAPVVEIHQTRIVPDNAVALLAQYDVVVEGSDNFATKFLVADACRIAKVPVVHGAAVRWHGTVMAVSGEGAPCYRCVFEDVPRGVAPNCAEAGVMGPVVGVVGAIQADMTLAIVDGSHPFGTLVRFDGKTSTLRKHHVVRQPSCELCGIGATPPNVLTVERYVHGDAC